MNDSDAFAGTSPASEGNGEGNVNGEGNGNGMTARNAATRQLACQIIAFGQVGLGAPRA